MPFTSVLNKFMAIKVELVYASTLKQTILQLQVPEDTTIETAIKLSGLLELNPELIGTELRVGIFSKPRSLDWLLKNGDRIEIYRPLRVDPKEARLERAKKHKLNKSTKNL
jgi:putative ubiquitin-RnfH superfamily antitoxin RatB of RatAB toxin-antitoxin module